MGSIDVFVGEESGVVVKIWPVAGIRALCHTRRAKCSEGSMIGFGSSESSLIPLKPRKMMVGGAAIEAGSAARQMRQTNETVIMG